MVWFKTIFGQTYQNYSVTGWINSVLFSPGAKANLGSAKPPRCDTYVRRSSHSGEFWWSHLIRDHWALLWFLPGLCGYWRAERKPGHSEGVSNEFNQVQDLFILFHLRNNFSYVEDEFKVAFSPFLTGTVPCHHNYRIKLWWYGRKSGISS